jgi:subtilisin-like proprotein convertase family protein
VIEKVSLFDNVYLLAIESNGTDGKDNVFDVANKYVLTQFVEFAQPNFIRYGMLLEEKFEVPQSPLPNDTMLPKMWDLKNTGSNVPSDNPIVSTPGSDANVIPAWDITTGNPNLLVSIVDTGMDTNQVDLRSRLSDPLLWYDAYENDQFPQDEYGHGTPVASIVIAEGNNTAGIVGVAYTCKDIPVRVFGPAPEGFTTDLILGKGLNWAWMHGASVISCSWGGGIPTPLITLAIQNAVRYGRNGKGTLVFGGAGNDDTNKVIYPASMDEVIAVGGLSPCNERKSKFSCDVPGGPFQNWGACWGEPLDVVAPCTFIAIATGNNTWCYCGNGTSDSSPLAAAVAALIMSKNNNLSGDSVRSILERSCVKAGNYNYNIQKVHGSWNEEMGYGRVDARLALDMTPPGGSSSIDDQVPPIIKIFPQESRVFSTNISFTAEIYDLQGLAGGNNTPKLYYRTIQHPSIQSSFGSYIGNNLYRFNFPLIPRSEGFYYYISAQDIASEPNVVTYPIGGRGVNPPGNIAPPKLMFVRNTSTYDTIFASADVPIPISSSIETTFVSLLPNIPGKTVLDVNCTINVEHTFDADLTFSLISPLGTEIVLAGGVGWDGDNFNNTTFDDEASISIDSSAALPPFTGTYKPIDKLWLFDGENSGGTWKLRVTDNGRQDGGALIGWGVKFKFARDENIILPGSFALVRNYPNPFNPKTRIVFNVPRTANIKITIYDISGREVKTLLNESRPARLEDYVDFDVDDPSFNDGKGLASGVYFYNMVADGKFIESKRMVLIK